MTYQGKKHYVPPRESSLWFYPLASRDRNILHQARRLWDHPAARAVMDSLRPRHILGGCLTQPAGLGALLSQDGAFPAHVRPNRHHRRRFPVDRQPEKRGWFPQPRIPDGPHDYFRDGAPAKISRIR